MERRCFATDGERAVMPAFGAYTGGLSIRDAAFAKMFRTLGFIAHVLGDNRAARDRRVALLLKCRHAVPCICERRFALGTIPLLRPFDDRCRSRCQRQVAIGSRSRSVPKTG